MNKPTEGEMVEALIDMVSQHCSHGDGLDSGALTANAEAMRLLARIGAIVIEREYGRRVIGQWRDA